MKAPVDENYGEGVFEQSIGENIAHIVAFYLRKKTGNNYERNNGEDALNGKQVQRDERVNKEGLSK